MDSLDFRDLGHCSFEVGRTIQEDLIQSSIKGDSQDCVLFCEHPLTITSGRRSTPEEKLQYRDLADKIDAEFVAVTRGGQTTIHAPGQLVIYPVINLKAKGYGIKRFVMLGLTALQAVLENFSLDLEVKLEPLGLWVTSNNLRKIASAGLQVSRGVTNHGFSLNVNCDLRHYTLLNPCGLSGSCYTSLDQEIGDDGYSRDGLVGLLKVELNRVWAN